MDRWPGTSTSTPPTVAARPGAANQAASESDNTSERVRDALAEIMRDGKPMGGGRCFGFEAGGEDQRPTEVAVVREMATRMLAGESVQTLAAELNGRGLRTVRDGEWTGANLGRLLGAHRYGGLVEHHGQIVGTMRGEPVLDRDTYDDVQSLLASRRRGRRPTGLFFLTGLLTCSTCQRTMNGAHKFKPLADGPGSGSTGALPSSVGAAGPSWPSRWRRLWASTW